MSASLAVHADAESQRAGAVSSVIASLPESLHVGGSGVDLEAVTGRAGWTQRVVTAVQEGTRGVLVVDPMAEDTAALRQFLQRRPAIVVVDRPTASSPALGDAAPFFIGHDDARGLVEARAIVEIGADLDRALLDLLSSVRRCASAVQALSVVARTARALILTGELVDGRRVRLTLVATRAQPPEADLRLLSPFQRVEVAIPAPTTARPAVVTIIDAGGATTLPSRFESAHRNSWRRLRDLVVSSTPCTDLDELAVDTELLQSLGR